MATTETTCTIVREYGNRFALNYGCMRSNKNFKTIAGATRYAEKRGFAEIKLHWNCTEGLTSIAREVEIVHGIYQVTIDQCLIRSSDLEAFNAMLLRLGHKPVRVTRNMLNPTAGPFLIDADTPSYCDPGSEAYHSM